LEFAGCAFEAVNGGLYSGMLKEPDIYCADYGEAADTAGAFFSPDKRYYGRYEPAIVINTRAIGAMVEAGAFLNVYEGILDTMAHEAVHYWCWLNDVNDTDEQGAHNELFRVAAIAHGLECEERDGSWGATALSLYGAIATQGHLTAEALDDML